MLFRYARHTTDLNKMEHFYTQIVGLEKLGGFQDHDTYDGLFLGLPDLNWHLEFTISTEKPTHTFDEDDALVFYVNTEMELEEIRNRVERNAIELRTPKNSYWVKNGLSFCDPDGFTIIFSVRHVVLTSLDVLTSLVTKKAITTWSDLIDYIRRLPYGRNLNREEFTLVLKEEKGTCSSKHAFLKKVADLNAIENVKLILGMYKMNEWNTPKIQYTIAENGLDYIPEAHCYLKLNGTRFDITDRDSNIKNLEQDILEEIEIEPEQVNTFKVDFHQNYLKKWIVEDAINMSFDKVWEIREQCIKKLGE